MTRLPGSLLRVSLLVLISSAVSGLWLPGEAKAIWPFRPRVVVNYSLPSAPVVVSRPVVVGTPVVSAPIVTSYAPATTTYYAPATTTYYAPSTYVAPTTTYYAPATTTYVAPATTTYYAPATTTYYAPSVTTSYYVPARVSAPVIVNRPVIWVP